MSKMFQIHEGDLVELERIVPEVMEQFSHTVGTSPRSRTQIRKIKEILSNVRWNYQPHEGVEKVEDDDKFF